MRLPPHRTCAAAPHKFDPLILLFHVITGLLGVCTTVLKKICREHGIRRWPQRKLQSLNKMMNSIELAMRSAVRANLQAGSTEMLSLPLPQPPSPVAPASTSPACAPERGTKRICVVQ